MEALEAFLNPALLTPLGIIIIEVLLLLLGWLVPKWQVENLIAENVHLRDTVKTLTEAVDNFGDAAMAQNQTADIVAKVMKALQKEASAKRAENGETL